MKVAGSGSRRWSVNDVVAKILNGPDDAVLGQRLADRTRQLLEWANSHNIGVQDLRKSTSGNIRFYLGGCDLFLICARAKNSIDLREEAIWIMNKGRPHHNLHGLAFSPPFDDVTLRRKMMHRLRDEVNGLHLASGFGSDLSEANPYLPLKLLVPDANFAKFCEIYEEVVGRIRSQSATGSGP